MLTEEELHNSITKHINKPLDSYFISFGLNLINNPYLYSGCGDYHNIYLVRVNSEALGFTINNKIYFNIPNFEKRCNKSIEYLASLLVSVYAHESTDHDIIDYRFIPPIKEVQEQLDKYYSIEEQAGETLPCYFSMALLGCDASANQLYKCGKGLLLSQYYILRDNIIQNIE